MFSSAVVRVQKLPSGSWAKSPTGDVFVKPALKKGILPEILEELLGARKRCTHTRSCDECGLHPSIYSFNCAPPMARALHC